MKPDLGQRWADRLWAKFLEDGLLLIAITVIVAFLLPLADFRTSLIQFIAAIIFIVLLTRFVQMRRLLVIAIGLLIFALAGLAALLLTPGRKYVVPVAPGTEALFIQEIHGPDGVFRLVPTIAPFSPKRWLLSALAALDNRIILVEPRQTSGGYVVHSPTETAARALADSGQGNLRFIHLPSRQAQISLILNHGDSQLSFTFGLRRRDIILRSDASATSPGLFGIATPVAPDLEGWRRLAFSEELLRSLPKVDSMALLDMLGAEADRTGRTSDRLRMLVFRLELINQRYSTIESPLRLNFYELATLGNLRSVAEQFNAAMPTRALQTDPWLTAFTNSLVTTTSSIPGSQLQLQGSERAPREVDWLGRIVRRLSDTLAADSLQVQFALADSSARGVERRPGESPPRTLRELIARMTRPDPAQEIETGQIVVARALVSRDPDLTSPEVVRWVEAGGEARGHRIALLFQASSDAFAAVWLQRFGQMLPDVRPEILLNNFRTAERELQRHIASLQRLLPLVRDPDQRRLLEAKRDLDVVVLRMMSGLNRWEACAREPEAAVGQCVLNAMTESYPAEFGAAMATIRAMAQDDSPIASFVRNPSAIGTPYSSIEAGYLAHLAFGLGDLDGDVEPTMRQRYCELVASQANALIAEGRVDDRVSVLALQAEILRLCGRPEAARLDRLFQDRQLSFPSWRGRIFDRPASTSPTPG